MIYPESAVKVLESGDIPSNVLVFPLHWHERMELTRVISGSLDYNIDGYHFLLSAGQAAIVSPCRPHGAFAGASGVNYTTVMFNIPDFYNRSEAAMRLLEPAESLSAQFVNLTEAEKVIAAIDRLVELNGSSAPFAELEAVGAVYQLFAALYRECLSDNPAPRCIDMRFKEVFEYIALHFSEPLQISELSRSFGYNEAYFCRRFKELAGISATEYIRILRLEKAAEQLRRQNTVSDAAIQCGFSSISHFSRCFKAHFGSSPAEFKKGKINKQVNI